LLPGDHGFADHALARRKRAGHFGFNRNEGELSG
jgi:hypothetical protein